MFEFLNKPYPFNTDLRYILRLGSGISIGAFLFILFFQPLELANTNVENYVLTIAGFAGITLLFISLVKIIIPSIFQKFLNIESWDLKREVLLLLIIWILNSVAFSFYLAFVGQVPLTMYLAFKIILICFCISVVIFISSDTYNLKTLVNELDIKNLTLSEKLGVNGSDSKILISLMSESRTEKIELVKDNLLLVRSAENYVEIVYREEDALRKKLIRSTMKSIEDQLRPYPELVRCHRTCIVNSENVTKLHSSARGIYVNISGYEEVVPVSRQYLLAVKTSLDIKAQSSRANSAS